MVSRLVAGASFAALVCAGLFAQASSARADPIGFALDGTCEAGTCPATPLAIGSSATLPVSVITTLPDGDVFAISSDPSFPLQSSNTGTIGYVSPFSIEYLGDGHGGTSQADALTADVYRSWATTSAGPVIFNTNHSAIFSSTIGSGSMVSAVDTSNGSTLANYGTVSSPGPFSETRSYAVAPSAGALPLDFTFSSTFASGSLPGSYITWNGASAPPPPLPPSAPLPALPSPCAAAVDGAVSLSLGGGGTQMRATFIPNGGLSLSAAAVACDVSSFNWQQTIDVVPKPYSSSFATNSGEPLIPPFNDPPLSGYTYHIACDTSHVTDTAFPFYYNPSGPVSDCLSLAAHTFDDSFLTFTDTPADPCLRAGGGIDLFGCPFTRAPPGSFLEFTTDLLGVVSGFPGPVLSQWTWIDTFNGTSGGIGVLSNDLPVDPGSGTGGIAILDVNTPATASVPEPGTFPMLVTSVMGLFVYVRFRRRVCPNSTGQHQKNG
jgi:hypothetical protein